MLLLDQVSHALTTELTAGLTRAGISPREHCVLAHALRGDRTQGELAEECALDKTTMVVTLDELEEAGLARRQQSVTDRRARLVTVTPAGKRKVAQADAIVSRIVDDVLSSLPVAERDGFVKGLQHLAGARLAEPAACEPTVRRPRQRHIVQK
jgi:MarR family transcriptional regulator, transcriptional regulator for hemolysin